MLAIVNAQETAADTISSDESGSEIDSNDESSDEDALPVYYVPVNWLDDDRWNEATQLPNEGVLAFAEMIAEEGFRNCQVDAMIQYNRKYMHPEEWYPRSGRAYRLSIRTITEVNGLGAFQRHDISVDGRNYEVHTRDLRHVLYILLRRFNTTIETTFRLLTNDAGERVFSTFASANIMRGKFEAQFFFSLLNKMNTDAWQQWGGMFRGLLPYTIYLDGTALSSFTNRSCRPIVISLTSLPLSIISSP